LRVLTVNAGSSSLKLRLLDEDDSLVATADLEMRRGEIDRGEVEAALAGFAVAYAVGHRIVHGGERFSAPVRIDPQVRSALEELTDLAPLHQPKSLAALDAVSAALPDIRAVACFDTAFHATMAESAKTYAVPEEWRRRYGLRRYGFHGLSHSYAARKARDMLDEPDLRLVTCHLGAGASLAAVRGGSSVDTTMGFTPLEGLVMATRSGSIDPGMLLWLLERNTLTVGEMADALEHDSGLKGLAGSADMREVLTASEAGDEAAVLARDVYVHRLRAGIAAMAAALGGVDALVFTGGVGENSPEIRARALDGLAFLSVGLDDQLNRDVSGDAQISPGDSATAVLVIHSREDIEIAGQVRGVLAASPSTRSPRRWGSSRRSGEGFAG
jgi:acetate kinase